jgi:uncharacterized glyoxalase superfamily metalloenzyme YdcJ
MTRTQEGWIMMIERAKEAVMNLFEQVTRLPEEVKMMTEMTDIRTKIEVVEEQEEQEGEEWEEAQSIRGFNRRMKSSLEAFLMMSLGPIFKSSLLRKGVNI